MTEPLDFRTKLRNAAAAARYHLSGGGPGFEGYNPTDKRAAAYHEIATVLMDEGIRTSNAKYQAAARMLQEQAEITTYPGPNGVAAAIGNMNALLQSRNYNIPLDYFSWRIDDAIVSFFEEVASRGNLWEISQNNILAVDGLVWDPLM